VEVMSVVHNTGCKLTVNSQRLVLHARVIELFERPMMTGSWKKYCVLLEQQNHNQTMWRHLSCFSTRLTDMEGVKKSAIEFQEKIRW